ncbi:MAG: response regulator [Candidatus Latescibacteria bacterium]|nr:response regulator [Candidatus Latescibacterota bacterium]
MVDKEILLVDDDSFAREPVQIALVAKGYQVDTAADGEEAVALLQKKNYDLVLSDIKMPNMDGLELLETVRQRCWDMPFILITAHGTIESAVRAMRQGAYDYLQKPVQLDELEIRRFQ